MKRLSWAVISLTLIGLTACSQSSTAGNSQPEANVAVSPTTPVQAQKPASPASPSSTTGSSGNLTQLFSRVWRVTKAPSTPAPGSIYVFLPNGTLLQTSCGETYRIASWTIDKAAPSVLRVNEDGQLAYTARIASLSDTTLQLQRTLVRSKETQALTLTAVQQEYVCPDSRR
jgi:hypothetical protein